MLLYSVLALASIVVEKNVETPTPPPPPVIMVPTIGTVPMSAPEKGRQSSPMPKNYPGMWANTGDYPSLALRELREGTTAFTVDVSVDGRVSKCSITGSSGHPDLDKTTCDNITTRAQFYPAQDKNGAATTGSYSNRVRWQIPEVPSTAVSLSSGSLPRAPRPSDISQLIVATEKYPATALAAGQQGQTTFMLNVDETGKVLGCAITDSSKFSELDQQACAIAREWKFEPALDVNGKPSAGKSLHMLYWRLPKSAPRVSFNSGRVRPNPFAKPGSIGLILEFDAAGKLTSCEAEGEGAPFGQIGACPDSGNRDVAPFLDSEGKPQAKRIKFRMSVEHEDLKTGAVSK